MNLFEERLAALWKERFTLLPIDCDRDPNPGINEVEEFREWSRRETTGDQQRIEEYIDRLDLTHLSILHVGIGNSQLAIRFSQRAKSIVGLTISPLEAKEGERLRLSNYRPLVLNKYSLAEPGSGEHFDRR